MICNTVRKRMMLLITISTWTYRQVLYHFLPDRTFWAMPKRMAAKQNTTIKILTGIPKTVWGTILLNRRIRSSVKGFMMMQYNQIPQNTRATEIKKYPAIA